MKIPSFLALLIFSMPLPSVGLEKIPHEMQEVLDQPQFKHAFWGVYVKDLDSGEVVYDLNSDKSFSPGSTTKLFTVAALLNAFGDNYRFKTPLYATQPINNGVLEGDIVIVGQGDLTMGGRQSNPDTIAFTKFDHTYANDLPDVSLTPQDPLTAFNYLAQQAYEKGLREVHGDIIIDNSLFNTVQKRGMLECPLMLNENLIDILINPSAVGDKPKVEWRPQVPTYSVINEIKTVEVGEPLALDISADPTGHKITIKGTIPTDQKDVVRVFPIKDPKVFARKALIQALQKQGINIKLARGAYSYKLQEDLLLGYWTSPPLNEYAKLILKVSHNMGANLIPLLLASQKGMKSFNKGMKLLGDFMVKEVHISPNAFVYIDGAGGNENRFTPQAVIQLLHYVYKLSKDRFENYLNALPILGVDGSLEDVARDSPAAQHIYAKPGTGISINLGTGKPFLITQALAGYIKGQNGHLYAYEIVVNNAEVNSIEDVFGIFNIDGQLSNMIYECTGGLY